MASVVKYIIIWKIGESREMLTNVGNGGYFELYVEAEQVCQELNELNNGNTYVFETRNLKYP